MRSDRTRPRAVASPRARVCEMQRARLLAAATADQGQVSKLLARLERIELLTNTGQGHAKGEPNAWRLTPLGERVARQLSLGTSLQEDAT